jgi:hypothetical protein
MALEAAERGEYETFHDLAWRTIQTGDRKDPALMYLLARAQSLSGRPHDALVMLQRLAAMNVPSDAATNDDFARVRALADWPELAAQLERLQPGGAAAAAQPSALVSPSSPASSAAPSAFAPTARPSSVPAPTNQPAIPPASAAKALRFSTAPFAVGGLAYDAASRRFLFGDRLGRKLIVVGEGSNQTSDLVHGDSAGFREISAIEIDAKRGDLWVATTAADRGAGTLHRLQLVSGRPLKAFSLDHSAEPVTLVDLAVTPTGTVLVLDGASRQLFALRAGATALEGIVRIDGDDPVSVAAPDRDGVAYVANRDGISRIDLRGRKAGTVAVPKGTSLGRLERIRWYRNALIALTIDADDTRRIIRLELNGNGTAVSRVTTLEASIPSDVQAFVTISGDDLVYVASGSSISPELAELVIHRVPLH